MLKIFILRCENKVPRLNDTIKAGLHEFSNFLLRFSILTHTFELHGDPTLDI